MGEGMIARWLDLLRRRRALRALIADATIDQISLIDDRKNDLFVLDFRGPTFTYWGVIWNLERSTSSPNIPTRLKEVLTGYLTDADMLARLVKPLLPVHPVEAVWHLRPKKKDAGPPARPSCPAVTASPPKIMPKFEELQEVGAALEKEFVTVFAVKTATDRERLILTCMERRQCSRSSAMQHLIEDLRKDQRSWR
jgi:hypothetical protein